MLADGESDSAAMTHTLTTDIFDDLIPMETLPVDQPLAVAVSGGPDSMALCYMLSRWAHDSGIQIHALTVDHGLREDSAIEANQVGLWLADLPNVRHAILTRTIDKEAPQSRIMEEARADRYALMAAYCTTHHISRLFVAHHRDDQAETFLFRLAKGSGLDGLACMQAEQPYNDTLTIVRPFLSVDKADILALCKSAPIPFVQDPSNENDHYARPRLRKSAAVLADEGLTPKRLAVTAMRLSRARAALEAFAEKAYSAALLDDGADKKTFDYTILRENPAEIRLRVLLLMMGHFNAGRDYAPRMEKSEELCHRIFGAADFNAATLGGVIFRLDKGRKILAAEKEKGA